MTNANATWDDFSKGVKHDGHLTIRRLSPSTTLPPLVPQPDGVAKSTSQDTFYKAGRVASQSAAGFLERSSQHHQKKSTAPSRFDLARPNATASTKSTANSPSSAPIKKRVSIGFGMGGNDHQRNHSDETIGRVVTKRASMGFGFSLAESKEEKTGHAFPSRDELDKIKRYGKADFSVPDNIRERAQRRNTIAHQKLASTTYTESKRFGLAGHDSDLADDQTPTLGRSISAEDCVAYSNSSIRRNSADYRSHVEYYVPKLQTNKYAAIKQGCVSKDFVKQMTLRVEAASYNQRSNPRHQQGAPKLPSTLEYIINQSGLGETAEMYRKMNNPIADMNAETSSAACINKHSHTDDSVFAKMHNRMSHLEQ